MAEDRRGMRPDPIPAEGGRAKHDAIVGAETRGSLVAEPAEIPSADEIGLEHEHKGFHQPPGT